MDNNEAAKDALILAMELADLDGVIQQEKTALKIIRERNQEGVGDSRPFATMEAAMTFFSSFARYIDELEKRRLRGMERLDEFLIESNLSMNDLKKAMNKQIEEYEKENN